MSIYNGSLPIVTDGLVLHLDAANKKSYTSGSTWYDLSGNRNNGTILNGTSFNSDYTGSFLYDGLNDTVSFQHNQNLLFLNREPFTLEAWFKLSTYQPTFPQILCRETSIGVGRDGYNITLYTPIKTIFIERWVANEKKISTVFLTTLEYSSGINHVVCKYDGNYITTYLNKRKGNTTLDTRPITNTVAKLNVGSTSSGTSNFFSGNLFSVRIYNRSLSDDEIYNNYNNTKSRYGL